MAGKKILSLILLALMLLTVLPTNLTYADEVKGKREVYLHAQGENPNETVNTSEVFLGDNVNLYFAVDNPNMGAKNSLGEHEEPQYDLNGYTVKIYFDPSFFTFAPSVKTSGNNRFDYTIPDKQMNTPQQGNENIGENTGENVPQGVGYYIYESGTPSETVNGKMYQSAFITVFFSGEYLPDKKDGQLWYNLCALPLTSLKVGSSDVFLEIGSADMHSLELYAKNVNDDYPPNFKFTAVNGGYHTINVKNPLKPQPPAASPEPNSFIGSVDVALTADTETQIFYSTDDGASWQEYTEEINILRTTDIKCYAVRTVDGESYISNTVTYSYRIVPQSPKLFDTSRKLIPNIYSEFNPFTVLVSDKDIFGNIADDSTVYYTFSDCDVKNIGDGDDPEKEWVKVQKGEDWQKIDVDRQITVRLVCEKYGEFGDVVTYYLGITPAGVTAVPESGVLGENREVALRCETENAKIYYTTDGSDPKENGTLYTEPVKINENTTIKAVAVLDNVYGAVNTFDYLIGEEKDDLISAEKPAGSYEGDVSVKLIPLNPDYGVEYSTDGGNSWTNLPVGDEVVLDKSTEIIARVDKNGNKGEEYTFKYTIKPNAPVFAPEGTIFVTEGDITIYAPDSTQETKERFTLYYTTDGSDPRSSETAKEGDAVNDTAHFAVMEKTTVSAVIKDKYGVFSDVITHNYEVSSEKTALPVPTLPTGYYTQKTESIYTTEFMPVTAGTSIYYTVTYGDGAAADPVPSEEQKEGSQTKLYVKGNKIDIKGKTVIKAVAVNNDAAVNGVAPHSEIAVFGYLVSPEAPKSVPSGVLNGTEFPIVPVSVLPKVVVNYTVGGENYSFLNTSDDPLCDLTRFYIDLKTGAAYRNADKTDELAAPKGDYSQEMGIVLKLSCVLNGIMSNDNVYTYTLSGNDGLNAPFANYEAGMYEEYDRDDSGTLLFVELNSLNDKSMTEIEYMLNADGRWKEYVHGEKIPLKDDAVLHARCKKAGDSTIKSKTVSYTYTFYPLAPVIFPSSGRYAEGSELDMTINYDENSPEGLILDAYSIWYREGKDKIDDVLYRIGQTPRSITESTSFKSYVKNESTERNSANSTVHYYIIDPASGMVYTTYPFEVNNGDCLYISKHMLSKSPYADGIHLKTQKAGTVISYMYSYRTEKGTFSSEWMNYNEQLPVFVNAIMDEVIITAKLLDSLGNEIMDTTSVFSYKFVDVAVPTTSLEGSKTTEFDKGTVYTIIDDSDPNTVLYYSVDGNEPTTIYDGSELVLTESPTTVKAVFFKGCGECEHCASGNAKDCADGVFGETAVYRYTIPTVVTTGRSGGSGGGSANIRKYTKDIFGNEHPTHIGYINGYPDGTVRPDGMITREEVTAILYRIKNRSYDKPFILSGEVFSDVTVDRWSATEIEYMAENEVVLGYPDGEFKPAENLKRAEFAALISRFAGIKETKTENSFSDLADTHWAYNDILCLTEKKLIEGYPDGTFKPESDITRAEVMTVINKLLGRKPSEQYVKSLDFKPFLDIEKDKWFYTAVVEATVTHDYFLDGKGTEYKWEIKTEY